MNARAQIGVAGAASGQNVTTNAHATIDRLEGGRVHVAATASDVATGFVLGNGSVRTFPSTGAGRYTVIDINDVVAEAATVTVHHDIVCLSDITYVWTDEGWLYLAAALDPHSRRIVGHTLSRHIDSTLTETALRRAVQRRRPDCGLVHHSDRGVQYASGEYQKLLSSSGMIGSMSRKGN